MSAALADDALLEISRWQREALSLRECEAVLKFDPDRETRAIAAQRVMQLTERVG